eukprot:8444908-Ditylum_brightwellii.AAC.1
MYVHPPNDPATSIFPSVHGDQLAPAVMCQRKVQSFSHQKFTDQYEVYHANGGYRGIDMCYIGDVRRCGIRIHLDSLVKFGYMNKNVAYSMKDSADGVGTDDDGDECMCSESAVIAEHGATHVSFKDAIKLHKKMRSVHECTNMVVVEDVADMSDFFGNTDEWEKEGIFGT